MSLPVDWDQWQRAARAARNMTLNLRRQIVLEWADEILGPSRSLILGANQIDIEKASSQNHSSSFLERLAVTDRRLAAMADTLRVLAATPCPVGRVEQERQLPNGLRLKQLREPVGTVLVIFESRPNITTEVLGVGFWSGNAMILKGGKESDNTCRAVDQALQRVWGRRAGECAPPFALVARATEDEVLSLLRAKDKIQLLIPRGGEGLIKFCQEHARMPMLRNSRGLCHGYIHEEADIEQAIQIVVNAKASRPSVCNSLETILIDRAIAPKILPRLQSAFVPHKLKWLACAESLMHLSTSPFVELASPQDFDREHLDMILNCRVVDDCSDAIRHIQKHSSAHSEMVITRNATVARLFQAEVNSAVVYWNASTRFTDGQEFGLGGEVGISTELVFQRGPLGPEALTSLRWLVDGQGQVRQ